MKRSTKTVMLVVAFAMLPLAQAAQYDQSWFTIDSGGDYSLGGNFELEGTIGQPDAAPAGVGLSGGSFEVVGGFWSAMKTCGGNFDLDVYPNFATCLAGPGADLGAGCACFDLNADGDVDLQDFAEFQVNSSAQ